MDFVISDVLYELYGQLEDQIEEVRELGLELGCRPSQVRTPSGDFMLTPLLLAKAQTLSAMVMLRNTT